MDERVDSGARDRCISRDIRRRNFGKIYVIVRIARLYEINRSRKDDLKQLTVHCTSTREINVLVECLIVEESIALEPIGNR